VKALLDKAETLGKEKGKVVIILNFPNNPSGYMPTVEEGKKLADGLIEIAEKGIKLVVVTDDAYFGLFLKIR